MFQPMHNFAYVMTKKLHNDASILDLWTFCEMDLKIKKTQTMSSEWLAEATLLAKSNGRFLFRIIFPTSVKHEFLQ